MEYEKKNTSTVWRENQDEPKERTIPNSVLNQNYMSALLLLLSTV